jgi:hypothetical protein
VGEKLKPPSCDELWEGNMGKLNEVVFEQKRRGLSLDGWIALLAFALAALVRAGLFKHLPW